MSAERQQLLWALDLLLSISAGLPPNAELEALGGLRTLSPIVSRRKRAACNPRQRPSP
jgi:hypothetical protein